MMEVLYVILIILKKISHGVRKCDQKKIPTINIINQDSSSMNKDSHLVFQMLIYHGLVACMNNLVSVKFPLNKISTLYRQP